MKLLDNYNNGRIPSERILKHAQHPCYAIMHFSMNTYTNKEWGFGDGQQAILSDTSECSLVVFDWHSLYLFE